MNENQWTILPYPYSLLADNPSLPRFDVPIILERLLEGVAGQAGVLAAAALQPETDEDDVRFALQALAEGLHATVALWRQWRAREDADKDPHLLRIPSGAKVGTA